MKFAYAVLPATAALFIGAADAAPSPAPFTGLYMGIDGGYGWGEANSEHYGLIGGPLNFTQADADIDGFLVGGHLGYDWRLGPNWVFGLEGGVRYAGVKGDDGGSGGDVNELSGNWDASVTAHVGVMMGKGSMLYALGGFTWLDADSNVNNAPTETVSETFSGWTLGGGLACSMSPSMTWRLQYRYSDYDEEVLTFPVNNYDMATGPTMHELTVGVSWSF